jgi:hypothetical protein
VNYDEAIQWLSDEAAHLIGRAKLFAHMGAWLTEGDLLEHAAALITIENMLRYHAQVSRD